MKSKEELGCYSPSFFLFIVYGKYGDKSMFDRELLIEDITKTEIKKMIDDKLSSAYLDREIRDRFKDDQFKKYVREVVVDTFERFFNGLYVKKSFWRNELGR